MTEDADGLFLSFHLLSSLPRSSNEMNSVDLQYFSLLSPPSRLTAVQEVNSASPPVAPFIRWQRSDGIHKHLYVESALRCD